MAESAEKSPIILFIKVKMGGENDIEKSALSQMLPWFTGSSSMNEGWTADNIAENMRAAAAGGVVLIEQPLASRQRSDFSEIERPVTICRDESVHTVGGP